MLHSRVVVIDSMAFSLWLGLKGHERRCPKRDAEEHQSERNLLTRRRHFSSAEQCLLTVTELGFCGGEKLGAGILEVLVHVYAIFPGWAFGG